MSKHSQTRTNPGESKKATEKVYSYDMKGKDIKTNTNGQQTNNINKQKLYKEYYAN